MFLLFLISQWSKVKKIKTSAVVPGQANPPKNHKPQPNSLDLRWGKLTVTTQTSVTI